MLDKDKVPGQASKAAMELTKHLKVIEVDRGEQVPVRKECMFMMLQGKVRVTTHWKTADGMSKD